MARSDPNLLLSPEKDEESRPRLSSSLGRGERWLLRALRLWAQRRQPLGAGAPSLGRPEDWRVAFLASLEPLPAGKAHRRVQLTDSGLDDTLADINACLGIIAAAPGRAWRFHHPGCLGLDGDECLLLDLLRLAASDELIAATALLRAQFPGDTAPARAERALRYLSQALTSLAEMGLTLPRGGEERVALH